MDKFWVKFLKSVLLGFLIPIIVLYVLHFFLNEGDMVAFSMGVASIMTMLYCTYSILEAINNIKK